MLRNTLTRTAARWCSNKLSPGPAFVCKERYGMDEAPTKAVLHKYNAALVAAAACDGMDEREEAYVLGLGTILGLDEGDLRSNLNQEWSNEKIEATLKAFCANLPDDAWKGFLIYDCVRACSADEDYSPEERAKVRKLASIMGMGDDHVASIERYVIYENQLLDKGVRMMRNMQEREEHDWDDGF